MHLVYLEESGNTGNNLDDKLQPIFVLCAMVVPENAWLQLEQDLQEVLGEMFPLPRPGGFEIHASELRNGNGYFRQFPVVHRISFRDKWLKVAREHKARVIYRAIEKRRYQHWMVSSFGTGIKINPHVVAFPLVARVVDEYLAAQVDRPLGIFISDENKEIVRDIEKSIRVLRGIEGRLKLSRIIEKGFFINSADSLLLQLCDLCAYSARKKEEGKFAPIRATDQGGVEIIDSMLYAGDEAFSDVVAWVAEQQKKERPGA